MSYVGVTMRETVGMSVDIRGHGAAPDAVAADAVEVARAAAVEVSGDPAYVGDWLAAVGEGDRIVTHRFAAVLPAYRGWHWAVTVVRASRAKDVTVDEVVLLPGTDALLAPEWVPWSERVRPGDLGVGDVMVTSADDERLVPAYASGDDPGEETVAFQLGLGRVRVLSLDGRDDAAERWHVGDAGPDSPIAMAAPAPCATCGFWLPVRGDLGQLFGACTNEFAPDDGRVVAADHGCGGHSEALGVERASRRATFVDTVGYDVVEDRSVEPSAEQAAAPSAEQVEELGHS